MDDESDKLGSLEFFRAVQFAAFGLKAAHVEMDKAAGTTSKPLIEYLLSDKPLSGADRELLADLFAGEFRTRTGRKPRSKEKNELRMNVFDDYRTIMDAAKMSISGRPNHELAIEILCKRYHPMSRDQIVQVIRHRTMRVSQTSVRSRKKTPD